jgi:cytochrome c-type biogenesis protein CcmH
MRAAAVAGGTMRAGNRAGGPSMVRPRHRAAAGAAAVFAVLLLVSWARGESLDDRVYAVARRLMCPVCAGQTVAESDAAVAREMRAIIRQKLSAGETPDQIIQFFVSQLGESVLAEPPRRGVSLLLYVGPPAALAAGIACALLYIRRSVRSAPHPAGGEASPARDPGDLARLARDLEARER